MQSERTGTLADGVRGVAIVTGLASVLAMVALLAFFTVGAPFGGLNDILNGVVGVLSGILAIMVYRTAGGSAGLVGLAVAGAVITVIGSWLIVSGTTGFVMAGNVSAAGFGLIGAWLLHANASALGAALPRLQSRVGVVAGAVMLVGVVAISGVVTGVDSVAAEPWWITLSGASWLGTLLLYPAWCLLFLRRG